MSFDNNSAIGLDSDPCLALGVNLYGAENGFRPQAFLRRLVVVVCRCGSRKHRNVDVEFQWLLRCVKAYNIPLVATAASHDDVFAWIAVDESGFVP